MKQDLFLLILLFFSTLLANELKVEQIFLEGSILNPKEEISGMDWYKEHLFLLPENQNNYLYVISKVEIYKSLSSLGLRIEPSKKICSVFISIAKRVEKKSKIKKNKPCFIAMEHKLLFNIKQQALN